MHSYEICIIGGGPAGASAACKLAQLGYKIILIERCNFPREHVGESLTQGVFTLLKTIGVDLSKSSGDFTRYGASLQKWNNKFVRSESSESFLVDRSSFDHLLLSVAKKAGVTVLQPAEVVRLNNCDSGWEVKILHSEEFLTIHAAFLVDASGRKSVLKGIKKKVAPTTVAISAYWRNAVFRSGETILEAAPDHWLWGGKLPGGKFNVTVFFDPKINFVRSSNKIIEYYHSAIDRSQLLRKSRKGELIGNISAFDVTPYYYETPVQQNFIKIGEANFGIDPISSQGVQCAILNAVQGAIVVNTILSDDQSFSDAAEFFEERQKETITRHSELASKIYATALGYQDHLFWQKRAKNNPPANGKSIGETRFFSQSVLVQFSDQSVLSTVPCIVNNRLSRVMALSHPRLKRPVAFWDNIKIVSILGDLKGVHKPSHLILKWSKKISMENSIRLFNWLNESGVITSKIE
jgi:flavin-dependent dehydrogenase